MTHQYKTNLRCAACEQSIKPHFDAAPGIKRWSVDLASPDKVLTVEGDASESAVAALLDRAGYRLLGPIEAAAPPAITTERPPSYYPLFLVVAYILGVVLLVEWAFGPFDGVRAMNNFMAGFFLVFSFFKLLDLPAFAESFAMYDLVAMRSRPFALAYPFIELGLGIAYLTRVVPFAVNLATLVVMSIGTAGVLKSLLARRKIRCACLGAVFNLPMSTVTLIEDVSMAGMAAYMLIHGLQ